MPLRTPYLVQTEVELVCAVLSSRVHCLRNDGYRPTGYNHHFCETSESLRNCKNDDGERMSSEAVYFPDALTDAPELREGEPGTPVIPIRAESTATEKPVGASISNSELSDDQLIKNVSGGAKDALAQLFRKYARAVRNVAYRILRDESEADDLVQEVFLFLFEKAALFDASKGSASSWIIQIAYHRALNRRQYLTVRRHYDAHELEDQRLDAGERRLFVDAVVAKTLLNRLREQVSVEQRQTLELHHFEGYSFREIAEKTGQTLGNVRNHYYRGLERLRACVFPQKGI